MWKKYFTRLYLPAFTIITVVLTLLIILIISTQKNLDRQRKIMEQALNEKGDILLRTISAVIDHEKEEEASFGEDVIDVLSTHLDDPDILYFYVITPKGRYLYKSEVEREKPVPKHEALADEVRRKGSAEKITRDMSLMELGRESAGYVEVVGLDMKRITEARGKDVAHTVFMGVILLILGTASIYFVFVIQNYYLVERTLERVRSFTENVVESMPDALISLDPEGSVVTMNRAAKLLTGFAGEKGRGVITSMVPPDKCEVYTCIEEKGHASNVEGILTRKGDGGQVPISVSGSIVRDGSGNNIGTVLILRDMREIRSLQEKVIRSEKLATAGTLASGLAHEIRNPLSSIRGFAHFFKKHFRRPSKEREYLDLMITEIDRVNRTITDLLTLSSPRTPVFREHSLAETLEKVVSIAKEKAFEKGVSLDLEKVINLPGISYDGDMVHQAILNLVINGIEATPRGGRVKVSMDHKEEEEISVSVEDTGGGVDESIRKRIFDPFVTSKERGTGLGLSMVQRVVDMHKWDISISSVENKGTTFVIAIPASEKGVTE